MFMGNINKILKKRSVRYGIPFLLLVVGGSFGLEQFARIRYTFTKHETLRPAIEKAGLKMKKPGEVTLESEYEKLKQMDIDTWENKRGPRPWEEDTMKENLARMQKKVQTEA